MYTSATGSTRHKIPLQHFVGLRRVRGGPAPAPRSLACPGSRRRHRCGPRSDKPGKACRGSLASADEAFKFVHGGDTPAVKADIRRQRARQSDADRALGAALSWGKRSEARNRSQRCLQAFIAQPPHPPSPILNRRLRPLECPSLMNPQGKQPARETEPAAALLIRPKRGE